TDYNPASPKTHFAFIEDRGSLARASLRCIGVGKCRRLEGGTMCPSFMVTREEKHSTRGRARLLFEMLQGNPLDDGWRSPAVKDALDLCLSCKGCKGDCPVNVDMATYKAEFLSHYYKGRLRPITAYTMGLIHWWVRPASLMPGIVNFFTQTPLLRTIVKRLGGFAPERQIPVFAPQTFKSWFRQREKHNEGKPKVILWPDTFNNNFHPETAVAAVEVLEAAGYQVEVPLQAICCGRPLYDYGMLDLAKHVLWQVLVTMRSYIRDGIPIVGLEPSCVAVFRDELVNLFPHDEDAKRLSQQTYLLSEFLTKKAENYDVPQLQGKALVHGHCHHKALMKMRDEETILSKIGLDYTMPDSGCCGMAGAFGFEKEHYDVSLSVGERVLIPAVQNASHDTLIIADGFSCREQIRQTTDRQALHLAEVLQMAMHQHRVAPSKDALNGNYPEKQYIQSIQTRPEPSNSKLQTVTMVGSGLLLIGGIVTWLLNKRK
ncbi:MAG: (Fe-S)-binding protein, partial [Chloroflexota bacterium]|nr:(Fe-S)-binding protein [Chloroflexota bacterium]